MIDSVHTGFRRIGPLAGLVVTAAVAGIAIASPPNGGKIDFDREIRPILSENCFACHGPDDKARKAKLRLDTRTGAFAELRSGGRALVPGKPAESELFRRVTAAEVEERMPPSKSGKKLTAGQIDRLRLWIEQCAHWSEHWAFVTPTPPALPNLELADVAA